MHVKLSPSSLEMALSIVLGKLNKRSVWPVGAVSKMMRLKCENSGSLRNCTTCEEGQRQVEEGER